MTLGKNNFFLELVDHTFKASIPAYKGPLYPPTTIDSSQNDCSCLYRKLVLWDLHACGARDKTIKLLTLSRRPFLNSALFLFLASSLIYFKIIIKSSSWQFLLTQERAFVVF